MSRENFIDRRPGAPMEVEDFQIETKEQSPQAPTAPEISKPVNELDLKDMYLMDAYTALEAPLKQLQEFSPEKQNFNTADGAQRVLMMRLYKLQERIQKSPTAQAKMRLPEYFELGKKLGEAIKAKDAEMIQKLRSGLEELMKA